MELTVFVESLDGKTHLDLAETTDQQGAADLVWGIMKAASGEGFRIGVAIHPAKEAPTPPVEPPTPPVEPPAAGRRR